MIETYQPGDVIDTVYGQALVLENIQNNGDYFCEFSKEDPLGIEVFSRNIHEDLILGFDDDDDNYYDEDEDEDEVRVVEAMRKYKSVIEWLYINDGVFKNKIEWRRSFTQHLLGILLSEPK